MEMCERFQITGWIEKSNAETRVAMAVTKKQACTAQVDNHSRSRMYWLSAHRHLSIYLAFHLTPLTHLTHPSTTRAFSSSPSTPPSLINSTV